MERELSRNGRRLAALAAFGVFWGAFLVVLGLGVLPVLAVLAVVLGAAGLVLERTRLAVAGQKAGAATRRVDWSGLRSSAGRHAGTAGAAVAAAGRRAGEAGAAVRAEVTAAQRRRGEAGRARRLNEQAAALRQEGRPDAALDAAEQALAIFRSLGDRRSEGLTLNAIGLAQARTGDEAGAIDSYETAVAILTELGDAHGAGLVLANLGALHLGQGDEDGARAAWVDALERLEPGTPEHLRTAEQLRQAS
jgi:tetratricopeptide (TPR) repeat protein